ncbi:DUF6804 family protein [Flavobacterium sp. XGLA_31]|uniref:DUF6804 family protein n=1 Tax=Flavobacterium sp. XGLA_31 TaxID=3447666 RepID=UPI003F3E2145
MKGIVLLVGIALLLALAPLPIGYYTFLRLAVTVTAIFILVREFKKGISLWLILFIITAVLFNPIIPIYLYQKTLWMPIDIVAAILFFSYSFKKQ